MSFTNEEVKQLREALKSAFKHSTLEQALYYQLGKDLGEIALVGAGVSFENVILSLIQAADKGGWTDELICGLREENPGNPELKAFAEQYLRLQYTKEDLEKNVRDTNSFLDIAEWRTKLGSIERQVCSIEIQGQHLGTGFLIGKDRVMTNYHVVESLMGEQPEDSPDEVSLRFDFKVTTSGTTTNQGVRYELADEWLIDSSPYSNAEGNGIEAPAPTENELDYAILRVAGGKDNVLPGEEVIGKDVNRSWVKIPDKNHSFRSNEPLFIVQHPEGEPLKLALDTSAITKLNSNQTRVRYKTNTEKGSSGSPCFNSNWKLVALHHMGDPVSKFKAQWNQGIPISVIRGHLQQKGVL